MPFPRQAISAPVFAYANGERTGVHRHTTHQLVYAQTGLLTLFVNNNRWVVPPLRAVWVRAGIPHELLAHGSTLTRPLYFDPSVGPEGFDDVTVISVGPLLRELIVAIGEPVIDQHERSHIEHVIISRLSRIEPLQLRIVEPEDERLTQIADALRLNPADPRTLAQWGQHVGAGERTLVRLFATETGTTFARWRTQIRLHHSLVLLSHGATVTTAANRCGYSNTSSFIEQFRRTLGTTPGAYVHEMRHRSSQPAPPDS